MKTHEVVIKMAFLGSNKTLILPKFCRKEESQISWTDFKISTHYARKNFWKFEPYQFCYLSGGIGQEGGIGLRNLQKLILTAKLMDLKNLAFCELEKSFLPTYKNSKAFSNLLNDLKHDGIEILEFDIRNFSFNFFFQSFEVTEKTTFTEIYKFLIESIIAIPCFKNINMSAMKLNISPNIIMDFIKKLWKNRRLKSFDKNILYNFLMNSYLEKQEKWLKQLVPHPLCFSCGEKFETWDHLMFECREFAKIRYLLNLKN